MTREEAIEILEMKVDLEPENEDVYNMAIEAIEKVEKYEKAIEDIKTEIKKPLDEERFFDTENAKVQAIALMWCLEVIDKHIGGKE